MSSGCFALLAGRGPDKTTLLGVVTSLIERDVGPVGGCFAGSIGGMKFHEALLDLDEELVLAVMERGLEILSVALHERMRVGDRGEEGR